jgi:hypothetical protein
MATLLLHIAAYCKAPSYQDVMAINGMLSSGVIYS